MRINKDPSTEPWGIPKVIGLTSGLHHTLSRNKERAPIFFPGIGDVLNSSKGV